MGNTYMYLRTTTKNNKTTLMKKLLFFILFPILTYGQVQIGQDIDGEAEGDRSGGNIQLSSDGSVVAIAAAQNDGNGENSGHVRVYENQNGNWIQIGQDIDGEAEGDVSGYSISLSSSGERIAIGAIGNSDNGSNSGHVRIFENQNNNWIQIGQDIDGEDAGDFSGFGISLSSNGSIVAIGARDHDENVENGEDVGQVRIFEYQNNNWIQIGQDINGEGINNGFGENFGDSVALSDNGQTLVASGPFNNDGGPDSGQVRVYENQNNNWIQVGQAINGEMEGDRLGDRNGLSISSDGSVFAVASNFNSGNQDQSGHARIFKNQEGTWTQIGEDIDGESVNEGFGWSVSLSSDGNIIAIGAISGGIDGQVRLFKNINDNWIQIGEDINGEVGFGDFFGGSVSLSSDGSILAVGDTRNNGNGNDSGHVRVFDLSALLSIEEFTQPTFSLFPNPASTQITIDIPQGTVLEKATIYNHLGQLVMTSKNETLDTSTLSKGMYIVEVLTNQGTSSKKLIIE